MMSTKKATIISIIKRIMIIVSILAFLCIKLIRVGIISYPNWYIMYDFNMHYDEYSYVVDFLLKRGGTVIFISSDTLEDDLKRENITDDKFIRYTKLIFKRGLYTDIDAKLKHYHDIGYDVRFRLGAFCLRIGNTDGISCYLNNDSVICAITHYYPVGYGEEGG